MSSDSELLETYASRGDETAFRSLVERHLGLVHAAALRRLGGNTELAREVSQEVFVSLARKAGSLAGHSSLEAWLYQATRFAALAAGRAEARRARLHQTFSAMCEAIPPETPVDWEALRPVLDAAMDELRDGDRELMLLRYFLGLSHGEIGARLGLAENTARMRGERALERLRRILVKQGIPSTGVALAALMSNPAFAQAVCATPAGLAPLISHVAFAGTATAGVLTGGIAFMSTTKVIAIAGLVTAASIGGTVYSRLQATEADARSRVLEQRFARAETQRVELTRRLQALQAEHTASEEKLAKLAGQGDGRQARSDDNHATANASGSASRSGVVGMMDILASSPEYQRMAQRQYLKSLPLEFGLLYRKLGLSREKIDRLEPLMAEAQQLMWDTMSAARSSGLSTGDSSLAKLNVPDAQEVYGRIRELLGESGFNEYMEYTRSAQARQTVSLLAGNLYYTEQPLTAGQAEVVIKLIKANSSSGRSSGMVSEGPQVDWENVYAQSQGVLLPQQIATLRAQQEKSLLDAQANELYQRLLQESAARGPGL